MQIMESRPGVPTKVSVMIMKVGEEEAVEVGEVVDDPLLACLRVVGEMSRQPLQRVYVARRADLGVHRGVAHRSARQ